MGTPKKIEQHIQPTYGSGGCTAAPVVETLHLLILPQLLQHINKYRMFTHEMFTVCVKFDDFVTLWAYSTVCTDHRPQHFVRAVRFTTCLHVCEQAVWVTGKISNGLLGVQKNILTR